MWEPPTSRLPVALAQSGRRPAISISPADGQAQGPSFPGERGWKELCRQPSRGEGQEKKTSFEDSAGRVREERVGVVPELCVAQSPSGTLRASARPGREVTRAPASRGQKGGRCRVPPLQAEIEVSSRVGRELRPRPLPATLPG